MDTFRKWAVYCRGTFMGHFMAYSGSDAIGQAQTVTINNIWAAWSAIPVGA